MPNPSDTEYTNNAEKEPIAMKFTELPPLGFGNPDAHISIAEKLEDPIEATRIDKAGEFILSGEMFVPVDNYDDGCIDGRIATLVTFIKAQGLEALTQPIADEGHERAKVAGGGYMTALAMYIAAKFNGGSIEADLKAVTEMLTKEGVYCGAHTAGNNDLSGPACGCGANDDIDKILLAAVTHADAIRDTTKALIGVAGLRIDNVVVQNVAQNNAAAANNSAYYEGSTGSSRFAAIKEGIVDAQAASGSENPVAVSKDLEGKHQEAFIVLNYKSGVTLSQRKLQHALAAEYPDVDIKLLPQAFVVDVWRIVDLAKAMVESDAKAKAEASDADQANWISIDFETALQSGVSYQLATAAHLTDGSLRIIISE